MEAGERPEPTERERAHVRKLQRLIDTARSDNKAREAAFTRWRKGYKGRYTNPGGEESTYRVNLAYSNIATVLPRVYAKNPDISFSPREGVPPKKYELVKQFAKTGELITRQQLLDAGLKRRAKTMVRSSMVTCIGWWKVAWQETKRADPILVNRANDIQDNLERIKTLSSQVKDDQSVDSEAEQKELEDQLQALQQAPEVTLARGIVIDPVLSEDILILDRTIRGADEYVRAAKIAHRVWMTCEDYYDAFGYKPKKAKIYSKIGAEAGGGSNKPDKADHEMVCTFEVWDKSANTVYTLCDGEEGYCRPPFVPQSLGERWYPFFALQFNPVDGEFYGLSDVELLDKLVAEYNKTRDDLAKHRAENLPVRVAKKGGNLTEEDGQKIQDRQSGDLIWVNGVPGQPLRDDLAELPGIPIDINNYDTMPIRYDMETLIGGGDAARGSITKAKTATEAEIMAQSLQSRTAERQDALEDMLADVSKYVFEICLLEMTLDDAIKVAGPGAVWPTMSREEAYGLVSVEIKAGSTGKPNKLQEQDRWLEMLPLMQQAMSAVVDLRSTGQHDMAEAVTELIRETFRRFDERLDVDKFIPPAIEGDAMEQIEGLSPEQAKAKLVQAMALIGQMQSKLAQMSDEGAREETKAGADHKRALELERVRAEGRAPQGASAPNAGGAAAQLPAPAAMAQQPMAGNGAAGPPLAPQSVQPTPADASLFMSVQRQLDAILAGQQAAPQIMLPPPRQVTIESPAGKYIGKVESTGGMTKRLVLQGPTGQYIGTVGPNGEISITAPSGKVYGGGQPAAPVQ